jgi:CubicO group peptidase (beta-lactamase class C family)
MASRNIAVGEQVAWSKGYGYANLETKQPMSADTSFFEIASVTKRFTGAALMIAQEQGYLSIDDDINDFLIKAPFEVNRPSGSKNTSPITFRHLASHTSGIVDGNAWFCTPFTGEAFGEHQILSDLFFNYECPENSPVDLEGFLASYFDKEGLFYNEEENFTIYTPGKRYKYSNIATGLEGYLINLATGLPLDQYAMRNIFKPLGMHNTSWNYEDLDPENMATPYYYSQENQKLIPLPLYSLATWPDGGLKSGTNDMGRFLSAVMNFGMLNGTTILSKESVGEMIGLKNFRAVDRTGKAQDDNGSAQISIHWIGDPIEIEGRSVIGHTGMDAGITSFLLFDPKDKIGIVLLINRHLDDNQRRHILNLLDLLFKKAEMLKQKTYNLVPERPPYLRIFAGVKIVFIR